MNKRTILIVAFVALLFLGGVTALMYVAVNQLKSMGGSMNQTAAAPTPTPPLPSKPLPRLAPSNSLVVFNFRSQGDASSKYYAVGFARALADRLQFAPTCITQQPSMQEQEAALRCFGGSMRQPPSEALARKAAGALGARYALSGELVSTGSSVTVKMELQDFSSASAVIKIQEQGSLPNLAALQISTFRHVLKAMRIKAGKIKPNFSVARSVEMYGRSVFSKSIAECEKLRWQAIDADPKSIFAASRLLGLYAYNDYSGPQLRANKRLQQLLSSLPARDDHGSGLAPLKALILTCEFDYANAERILADAVKANPMSAEAHASLCQMATWRMESDLAAREGQLAAQLWPTNARMRVARARGLLMTPSDSNPDPFAQLFPGQRSIRSSSYDQAYNEAIIAAKLNPGYAPGWSELLTASRKRRRNDTARRAFEEMIRINPYDKCAYEDYCFALIPEWGNDIHEQERVLSIAERNYGKDSIDVSLLKMTILLENNNPSRKGVNSYPQWVQQELLRLADEVAAKSKGRPLSGGAQIQTCRAMQANHRRADAYRLAKEGYEKWGTPAWQFLYGMGCQYQYEDNHDPAALEEARRVFANYVTQIPYNVRAIIRYGWCLSHQGKREEAKQQFLRALQIDPGNPTALEKLKYVQ